MFKMFLTVAVVLLSQIAIAQKSEGEFINELATPNMNGAKAVVYNETAIDFSLLSSSSIVKGYRIRIFFDNKQDSRARSMAEVKRFEKLYPTVPTDIEYVAPYFKVTVGAYLSRTEAIAMCGKFSSDFPKAFVVPDEIKVSEIIALEPFEKNEPILLDSSEVVAADSLFSNLSIDLDSLNVE